MARDSRRFSVWLPKPVLERLQQRAADSYLGMAAELRQALIRGLTFESPVKELEEINQRQDQLEAISLASLVATEQLIRFMVRHYPEGERRMLEVAEAAFEKAEGRLFDITERLAQEASPQ